MTEQLDMFEQQPVFESSAVLKAANGPVKKALKRDGRVLRIGETVRVVLDVECVGIRHETTGDDGPLSRIHVLKVTDGHYA